jgi:hypothetical protein
MHDVAHFFGVLRARASDPTSWIGVRPLAVRRVGVDLPWMAARRGPRPRSSWAGPHEAERDGSEQCPFRTTRRQLDADARNVFDHARANRDQAVSDRPELSAGERARPRDRGAHAVHQPERGGVKNEPDLIGDRAVYARIERFQRVAATNFSKGPF